MTVFLIISYSKVICNYNSVNEFAQKKKKKKTRSVARRIYWYLGIFFTVYYISGGVCKRCKNRESMNNNESVVKEY